MIAKLGIRRGLITLALSLAFAIVFAIGVRGANADFKLIPQVLATHYVSAVAIPTMTTTEYTGDVWLKSIEFIPQSTTAPTCTVANVAATMTAYNAIQLQPHTSYRDTRPDTAPLFMAGGITWSCSDSSVKAQLMLMY